MAVTKVSLSLSEQDVAFLDQQTLGGRYASRSAAVHDAVRLLRESQLADAYAEAYAEWNESGEADVWTSAEADGIA